MSHASGPRLFVTGATGELGRLVIDELLKRAPADRIVAGVRDPNHEQAVRLRSLGVGTRVIDYERPETLEPALDGIDRLLLISAPASPDRIAQHQRVIEAAKRARLELVAYTSLLHADRATSGLARDHKETEAALKASGLPHVLLRHGWYIENHVPSVAPALGSGAVIGCAGQGRFSSAARADFAAADATVLTLDGQAGRVYELAGDESYGLADLAAAIAAGAGRPVVYRDISQEAFTAALLGMGLPEEVATIIADSDRAAARGELEDHARQLSALIGRPTTPFGSVIKAALVGAIARPRTPEQAERSG